MIFIECLNMDTNYYIIEWGYYIQLALILQISNIEIQFTLWILMIAWSLQIVSPLRHNNIYIQRFFRVQYEHKFFQVTPIS